MENTTPMFSGPISPPVKAKLTASGEGFDTYIYPHVSLTKKLIKHLHPDRKAHAKKYWRNQTCMNLDWNSLAIRGKKYEFVFHTIETSYNGVHDYAICTAKLPAGDTEVKMHITGIADYGRGKFKKFIKNLFSTTLILVTCVVAVAIIGAKP